MNALMQMLLGQKAVPAPTGQVIPRNAADQQALINYLQSMKGAPSNTWLPGMGPSSPQDSGAMQVPAQAPPQVPLDLTTGLPATAPPLGSNVVQPVYGGGPFSTQDVIDTLIGKRNESIYPKAR